MSCKNNSSNPSSELPTSILAAILKRLFSRPHSTASHLFARTLSFHPPVSFRPVVSVLDSASSGPGLGRSWGHCAVFSLGRHFTLMVPLSTQGPVVQKPINANPRLKINQEVYFSTPKCCSTLIFSRTLH